jgi:hypothetical protein
MGRNSTGGRSGGQRLGTRVVGASSLRGVRDSGGGRIVATDPARLQRVRGLFDAGKQNQGRGVVVAVSRSGKMEVVDGRHRIIVARERGAKLKVTFTRGRS